MAGNPEDVEGCINVAVAGGLARITLVRPKKKNALTHSMMTDLLSAVRSIGNDDGVRIVVMDGAGTDFCSGADVQSIGGHAVQSPESRADSFERGLDELVHPLVQSLASLKPPLITSARGYAVGIGMQLLLLSDLVVASTSLKCLLPQVRLGHTLDHGESWWLTRRIGYLKAMEICLLNEPIDAAQAKQLRLVNWVVEDAELETVTGSVTDRLLAVPPISLWRTKALLRGAHENSFEAQLRAERMHVAACAGSEDFVEAISAFREKRAGVFQGR